MKKIFLAVVGFSAAALLAWLSEYSIEERTLMRYRKETWPNQIAWTSTLKTLGYREIPWSEKAFDRLKTHPQPNSTTASIWVGESGCLLHIPASPYRSNQPETWECRAEFRREASEWAEIGQGLIGFEHLMKIAEKREHLAIKPIAKAVDPREIRY